MAEDKNGAAAPGAQPDLGAMVSRLLADPELVSRIAETVGIPAGDGDAAQPPKGENGAVGAGVDPLASLLSSPGTPGGQKSAAAPAAARPGPDRRATLLKAVRPFCSDRRQKTIDYLLTISTITDSLRTLHPPQDDEK